MAETITHELALHGSDLDKIIKTYEKDGIEAVKKLFASDPEGDMDHESLAKQDKKHEGVSNYNQVKKELINKYPSIKKCLIVSKRNMKKFLEINSFALIMIVAALLMLLSSCHGNRKRLSSNEESSFLITYSKKEIVIESTKSNGVVDHFFYKNGEYFASSDSILFFSTLKDTILNVTSYEKKYKIIIKKERDGVYKTSSYYVNDKGSLYFMISYSYDSKSLLSRLEIFRSE